MIDVRNDVDVPLGDLDAMRRWALDLTSLRPPDFVIGPREDPAVERWYAIPRNAFGNVYVHRFHRSDDDRALHDHPWDNRTWVLDGWYREHKADGRVVVRSAGDTVSRRAEEPHRVEIVVPPALTLFVTGPLRREWGFHCPRGWVPWKQFVETYPGGNRLGRGCGDE